jgi:CBS domain-containing protein
MKSRVQDVMTTSVVSVVESAPFKQIVRLMETHGVSALPVVDADGKVVGVVSEGDMILKEAYEPTADGERHLFEGRRRRVERSKAAGLVAADLMTAPAVTVKGTATLTVAARLIGERNIKRLRWSTRRGASRGSSAGWISSGSSFGRTKRSGTKSSTT